MPPTAIRTVEIAVKHRAPGVKRGKMHDLLRAGAGRQRTGNGEEGGKPSRRHAFSPKI
jgi:hypothetical protein